MAFIAPCKDCKDRFAACHSTCTKYKEWKEEMDHIKINISQNRNREYEIYNVQKESAKRMKHYRKNN